MRGVMRLGNSKYRRLLKRLPDDAKAILESLEEHEFFVENFSPQYMGWSMDILVNSKRFNMIKEWHQVFVSEVAETGIHQIWPKEKETDEYEPKNIAHAIIAKIA
jgi:hypothetical protein